MSELDRDEEFIRDKEEDEEIERAIVYLVNSFQESGDNPSQSSSTAFGSEWNCTIEGTKDVSLSLAFYTI